MDVVVRAHDLLEALNAEYSGQKRIIIVFSHGITINALRTLFRDPAFVDEQGVVAFRKHTLENAEARWLGNSRQLAEHMFRL